MNAHDPRAGAAPTWRSEAFAEDLIDEAAAPPARGPTPRHAAPAIRHGWLFSLPVVVSLLGSVLLLLAPPV